MMLFLWIQFLPQNNESDDKDYFHVESIATGIVASKEAAINLEILEMRKQ
jgi:hypothetical protein